MDLKSTIQEASQTLLDLQHEDGYWWFTLEANETIGAGYIQLTHFLGAVDPEIQKGIVTRIFQTQNRDGSWSLYFDAPGDLNTTIECYFSLRLAGIPKDDERLIRAKEFILSGGGLTQARVFTRVHLALFGLVPWSASPSMPAAMMLLPPWSPISIYNFSSWARASIVPLVVVLNTRPVVPTKIDLEELYVEPVSKRRWNFVRKTSPISLERTFMIADKGMKYIDKFPYKPWKTYALEKAVQWTWEHMQKTEDIYPALAYGAMAFKAAGYANDSEQIQTALRGLRSFQQSFVGPELPGIPFRQEQKGGAIHQQCCISPVWDTPWSMTALFEADSKWRYDENLKKAGRWLLSKEIRFPKGDWHIKNPNVEPSGWSFEFKNEYFPDTDDTVQVLTVLQQVDLPASEKEPAIRRGLHWLRSMQNDDGGWGAFDKNNEMELVNKIPFSDHGACLDPSSPDITGRAIECLVRFGADLNDKAIQKAVKYLKKSQEDFGGWFGRWGVNYIYGTWAVLTGLAMLKEKNPLKKECAKACDWLASIQKQDGGFSESPASYVTKKYQAYPKSVPSQTSWAVMGLVAGGRADSSAARNGIQFLVDQWKKNGWEEKYFTGTGFPGHFYIRYHGYATYFPLLALGRYQLSLRAS
ncbi:MAG: squalene--hopene cyclase [Deltaproteobacteria bacterium]|nr:squalene--hopene cyclase [Deltaproteobacteria bacterium]